MYLYLIAGGIIVAAIGSLLFSSLTYSLRDFSRARLGDYLERRGRAQWLDVIVGQAPDLIFLTAILRLLFNLLVLIGVLALLHFSGIALWLQYLLGVLISGVICLFGSIALPHALALHAGEELIGWSARFLYGLRVAMSPATAITRGIDRIVRKIAGSRPEPEANEIEQEILSVVEEGEKEGVVDEQEREMIESVIEFGDRQVSQIMTARPDIHALEAGASLEQVKQTIAETGHSRIPVYDGTLDRIVGVLYARDLLKYLGEPAEQFDVKSVMRPAFYVPETKPLRDLLQDFRLQKVHIAIVLDEYGGTAGLVTIEDLLEELVGEISDEHEPQEPAMLKRIDERTADADARVPVYELNRILGLNIPEDAGYETLGGFVSTTLGRIPQRGTTFEHNGVRYTILDAEPQKVDRVKIELLARAVATPAGERSA